MISIKEAIIVEGRYDKVKISAYVDSLIIETKGFRIFKDKEKRRYIAKIAKERKIVILTDSDSAGFLIRNHLKSFISEELILNAYIPQFKGKEKRKSESSAEGFLGVEGMSEEVILTALQKAGVGKLEKNEVLFTTKDLFNYSITGKLGSKEVKQKFLEILSLPSYISNKDLLKYMNTNTQKASEALEKLENGAVE